MFYNIHPKRSLSHSFDPFTYMANISGELIDEVVVEST